MAENPDKTAEKIAESSDESSSFFGAIVTEIFQSPINLSLLILILILIYRIVKSRQDENTSEPEVKELPKLRKQDFTIEELKKYDGLQEDGRVLVAVNGKVYDVTKGKRFYGPGGPYAAFAGKDASRGLATFNVIGAGDQYDDLSDLTTMEMESVKEWETQFNEKYDYVGRLLKPGEQPTNYSDEEDESNTEARPEANAEPKPEGNAEPKLEGNAKPTPEETPEARPEGRSKDD